MWSVNKENPGLAISKSEVSLDQDPSKFLIQLRNLFPKDLDQFKNFKKNLKYLKKNSICPRIFLMK